jgi:hypothetical protein
MVSEALHPTAAIWSLNIKDRQYLGAIERPSLARERCRRHSIYRRYASVEPAASKILP